MLKENHRVVIANRRLDQTLGVIRGRRRHHLQPRRADEPHLRVLRMERPAVNASARWRAHHNRHRRIPSIPALRREIYNLIEPARNKIGELHFRHRTQPHEACANRRPRNRALGNRRIHYALLAKVFEEAGRNFKRAPIDSDVFSQQEDVRVALHLFPQSFADRFQISRRHGFIGFRRRHLAAWPGREMDSAPPTPPPRRFRCGRAHEARRSRSFPPIHGRSFSLPGER